MPVIETRESIVKKPKYPNRFSLVIGCDKYISAKPLYKAVNDAEDMHRMLKSVGFQSTLLVNATHDEMLEEKMALISAVTSASPTHPPIVLLFFSGHGMEIDKSMFLMSVDADPCNDIGLEVDLLLEDLNKLTQNMTFILLTDSCREDQDNRVFKTTVSDRHHGHLAEFGGVKSVCGDMDMPAVVKSDTGRFTVRGVSGHAEQQNANGNCFFLGYACKPGTVAMEPPARERVRNGYFTNALLKRMPEPKGGALVSAFMRVIEDVELRTQQKQGPWFEGGMGGNVVLFPEREPTDEVNVVDKVCVCHGVDTCGGISD
eukprot:GDKI01036889.1.p1 GENE.GDKI01036889.1~~GDKI01036889.1.p1  ORF type:complete len:346 (+),score=76.43 GDKI01036889.1:91-1038(+)